MIGTPLLQCVVEHIIEVVDNLSMLNSCSDNQDSHIFVQYCTYMIVRNRRVQSFRGVKLIFEGDFLDFSGGCAPRPHPAARLRLARAVAKIL